MDRELAERVRPRGWFVKFKRAQEHLHWLSNELEWFKQSGPYDFTSEFDEQTAENVFRLIAVHQPPPKWSAVIGDCVQNFRSALDHAAWRIAVESKVQTDRTQFPIFRTPEGYAKDGVKLIKGFPPDAQAVIEGLQPYHRGQDQPTDPHWALGTLHDLSRLDKHRDIHLTTVVGRGSYITAPGRVVDFAENIPPGPLKPDTVLARFSADEFANDAEVDVQFYFGLDVAFEEASPTPGRLVIPTLTGIQDAVAFALDQLEPFFPYIS